MPNGIGNSETISNRAAAFIDINYSGAHKDKRIARALGVSPAMARVLRAGRGWTVARLEQAAGLFGQAFRDAVWPPSAAELDKRLDRIEQMLAEVLRRSQGEK